MAAGAPDVVPVFITLDPRRDSCAQVGAYVKDFHSRMVGELAGALSARASSHVQAHEDPLLPAHNGALPPSL